jgi:hypothetical protein
MGMAEMADRLRVLHQVLPALMDLQILEMVAREHLPHLLAMAILQQDQTAVQVVLV